MAQSHPLDSSAGRGIMDALLSRLVRAKEEDVAGIVSSLEPRQRADLAVFCYRRAHLQDIGFAVAATCDLATLIQASPSNAAGHVLYSQSRERPKPMTRPSGPRGRITLATSASGNSALAALIAGLAADEPEDAGLEQNLLVDSPDLQPA
jgi:hypothetical protein